MCCHARTPGYRILACLVVALAGLQPLAARQQPKEPPPLLREALRSCEQRVDSLDPIWVRYRVKVFETGDYLGYLKTDKAAHKDARWEAEVEFAQKGGKRRSWGTRSDPPPGWDRELWFIFNGEVSVSKVAQKNSYLVSKQRQELNAWIEPPHAMTKEQSLLSALRACVAGSKEAILTRAVDRPGEAGGREVLLELRFPVTKWSSKTLLLPEQGWVVRREEVYAEGGVLSNRVDVPEQLTVNGISYPKRGTYEVYYLPEKLAYRHDFEVTFLETRSGSIPDRLFEFQFPEDAVIWDEDLKVYVRRSEVAQTHLEEVVRRIEGSRNWGWWLAAGVVGALLLGGGLLWVRRHRRRSLPPL